jgi:hypothetical protein
MPGYFAGPWKTAAITAAVVLVHVAGVQAQSILPTAVDAFVASADALAKSASEPVDLGRATLRLDKVRLALTNKLLTAKSNDTIQIDSLDEADILCGTRTAQIVIAAQRNYLQAVAAKIDQAGKPSQIDNITSAVVALFASQSIDIKSVADDAALKTSAEQLTTRCQNDLKQFDKHYYGREVVAPPGAQPLAAEAPLASPASLFGPIGSLIDTIVSVITPVVIEGGKLVDEAKRREAVRRFLSDPTNTKTITASGMQLAQQVSQFVVAKRHKLAGTFSEQLAATRAARIDLAKSDECKAYLTEPKKLEKRKSGAPSDQFVLCWRSIWNQLESQVSETLKAANDYDQLADAGDSDNAAKVFDPLSKSLAAIAQNQLDPKDLAKVWNWATELLAFADKVNAAASKDNRDKIQQAIDNLVKAL